MRAQIYREKYIRRRRRARSRNLAMARRARELDRGLESVAESDARDHRELQSQGGAAGTFLLQQLDMALRFLPTSEYGTPVPAAGGALEPADKPAGKQAAGKPTKRQTGGKPDDEDEVVCSICLADYVDDKMCSTLPCGHVFHRECITQWLRSGRMAGADCPLCKAPSLQATPTRFPFPLTTNPDPDY